MTSRNRVETRARLIYEHLKANLNTPYTIDGLLGAVGLHDSSTTRSAIRRARDLADDDGLCFPVACPANGQTYCVTDDPAAVVDPSLHLGSIALGVGVRKDVHDEFIASRMGQLSPGERSLVHSLDQYEAAQRASRDAHRSLVKAVVSMRKATRKADSS